MRRGGATEAGAACFGSGVSFDGSASVAFVSSSGFFSDERSVCFVSSSATARSTLASAAAAASLSAARRAAASCSVSRSTYLPPRRTRTGAPAAAATTMSASSTSGSDHVMGSAAASPASCSAASMRRFSTASSRWKAMAMLTWCATLRTSSMSSPAHANSSDATSIRSSASGAGGGAFCASTAFASLAHAAAFFWRAFAAASAGCDVFAFLPPHRRSTPLTSCSSCAMDLR